MPVIVITKRTWKWIFFLLAAIGLLILVLSLIKKKEPAQVDIDSPVADTIAVVDEYELSVMPLGSRELPVYNVQRDDKKIALTIDAAWSTDKTEFIMNELEKNNIHATFFLCGVWVKAYPDYVKALDAAGHEIANHSLTHPHMNALSADQVQKEITALDDIIEELIGKRSTLFRAPYGEYNNTVIKAVREIGCEPVQWNRDTIDWKQSRSTEDILNSVLPKMQSGDIILCHNNGYKIEEYLPVLIKTAQESGFTFVTVTELLLDGETKIDANGTQQNL